MSQQSHDPSPNSLEARAWELGVHPNDRWCLASLPLIRAAWIGGPPNRDQIEMVRAFFDELPVSPEGYEQCEAWFRHPPESTTFSLALQTLREFAADESHEDIGLAHLVALVSTAEKVRAARYTRTGSNVRFHTPAGDRALHEIADALGVDAGQTWAELLDELSDGRTFRRPTAGQAAWRGSLPAWRATEASAHKKQTLPDDER